MIKALITSQKLIASHAKLLKRRIKEQTKMSLKDFTVSKSVPKLLQAIKTFSIASKMFPTMDQKCITIWEHLLIHSNSRWNIGSSNTTLYRKSRGTNLAPMQVTLLRKQLHHLQIRVIHRSIKFKCSVRDTHSNRSSRCTLLKLRICLSNRNTWVRTHLARIKCSSNLSLSSSRSNLLSQTRLSQATFRHKGWI